MNIVGEIISGIIENLSEEMRIAMTARCEIEYTYEKGIYAIKTKYPVKIVRQKEGQIVVYENRDNSQVVLKAILDFNDLNK